MGDRLTEPINRRLLTSFFFLPSRSLQQEALTRLLVEKGIFTEEEFLEMVGVVDRDEEKTKWELNSMELENG